MTRYSAFDNSSSFESLDEYLPPLEGEEGFGCPNDYPCHEHCQSAGFRGGYCDSFLWLRCHCYS